MFRFLSITIIASTVLLFVFGAGFYVGAERVKVAQQPDHLDFSLFWEAYNRLERHFVDTDKIENEKIVHGAIRGMLKSLGDPYTSFFDKEESREFLENVSGYYEGVGMEVGLRNGRINVISPIEGTPASRAGLRAGDQILEIDGQSTSEMGLEKAVSLMRGERGTEVKLIISRDRETKEIQLVREKIQIPSISWEILENEVVYLKIHYFHQDLINEFNKVVPQITAHNSNKMIVDLRNNPGGALDSALDVANFFLQRDDIIVMSQSSDGEIDRTFKAKNTSVTFDHDLVILINQGSASASEILAGALKYHRDAQILGKTSFGKGSIQTLVNLSDMSNLKITVSNWVTPDGQLITNKGIVPDYEVSVEPEDFENEIDRQLDKALEVIKNR